MTMKTSFWLSSVLMLVLAAGCNRAGLTERSDADVARDVQAKINTDSTIGNKGIAVNSNNGTVTLSGTVGNETERMAAANDASSVTGVKQVVNNLTVDNGAMASNAPASSFPSNQNTAPARRATTSRGSGRPATGGAGTFGGNPASAGGSNLGASSTTAAPVVQQVTVPSGTTLVVYLNEGVSSETANDGDRFTATLGEPIYVNDKVAVPKNAQIAGRVVSAKSAGKFKGQSELILELSSIAYNGHSYRINSDKWSKAGSSRGKNTAMKVGGGAALGAIIGGIAGGGKGAAIGAGAGAAAGTGVQAITKGQQIDLKAEQMLQFTLEAPVTVTPASSNDSGRTRLPSGDQQ